MMLSSKAIFTAIGILLSIIVSAEQITISVDFQADNESATYFPRYREASTYNTRYAGVTWDNENWTLTTTDLRPHDFRASAFTANGYIGISMASNGPFPQSFAESSGWPLFDQRISFATVSGFFNRQPTTNGTNFEWLEQYGWDSVISGIPHWSTLSIRLDNGVTLDASTSSDQFSNVHLSQDFRQGLAKWQYTWAPESDGTSFDMVYTAFADKLHVNRAYVQLQVEASRDCNVSAVSFLDAATALRTRCVESGGEDDLIYSGVSPMGVPEVEAWLYSGLSGSVEVNSTGLSNATHGPPTTRLNDCSIARGLRLALKAGQRTTITKYVGIASTDAFPDPRQQARRAVQSAMKEGFNSSLEAHVKEWRRVMPKTAVADYTDPDTGSLPKNPALIEKALASVVSLFGLLMNTVSKNAIAILDNASLNINGISVCGLTSDCYGGQRFWDEDIWMHPYLAAAIPFEAKQITNNRVNQYPQAKENVKTAYQSSKNTTSFSPDAAVYPWTSGRDANCTATGPCFDYEYHLNGDIAHSFTNSWASSGDTAYFQSSLFAPLQSIATFFSDILIRNGSHYELTNLTDPDEYANHVDNGGFIMPLITDTLTKANWFRGFFGQQRNTTWDAMASNLFIPQTGDISLEYSNMNGSIEVKQADVVLKTYPLEVANYTLAEQLADLDYYAGHQSTEGPGMTYAIFSIDASEVSPSGCSCYTYDLGSWSSYVRAPWYSFSEQIIDDYSLNGGTYPAFPFLTGHGGFLQVDPYGYLGLRYNTNFTLEVHPVLPPQIPHLQHPIIHFHGWPVKAVSNRTTTTLSRLASPLSTANMTFANASITVSVGKIDPIFYSLPPHGKITIDNDLSVLNNTVPGNILQCRTVSSPVDFVRGQFPLAAIDGAISTVWQPTAANTSQSLTVDLTDVPFQKITAITFDWAQQPPVNATVIFHNQSSPESSPGHSTINLTNIKISDPFDAGETNVVPYKGNTTAVELASNSTVWSGNYVTLIVSGNQNSTAQDGPGAQVAEFAVVGSL